MVSVSVARLGWHGSDLKDVNAVDGWKPRLKDQPIESVM